MPNARAQTAAAYAVELIEGGISRTAAYERVASENDVKPRTVRRWIKDSGLTIPTDENMSTAFADFNESERQQVGNELVDILRRKIKAMQKEFDWGHPVSARDMKDIAVMFGVLTDKRRLEDGLATDRQETSVVPAREIFEAKILDLAERKKVRKLKVVDDD